MEFFTSLQHGYDRPGETNLLLKHLYETYGTGKVYLTTLLCFDLDSAGTYEKSACLGYLTKSECGEHVFTLSMPKFDIHISGDHWKGIREQLNALEEKRRKLDARLEKQALYRLRKKAEAEKNKKEEAEKAKHGECRVLDFKGPRQNAVQ